MVTAAYFCYFCCLDDVSLQRLAARISMNSQKPRQTCRHPQLFSWNLFSASRLPCRRGDITERYSPTRSLQRGTVLPDYYRVDNNTKQVRLSRATLEFPVLQVPTGLKVFNNQVIYLISFTKILRSKKSSIQNLSLPKKVEFLDARNCESHI